MGGGLEVDLSHGAVAELWGPPPAGSVGLHPVLQVADITRGLDPPPATAGLHYRLSLSDGVHSLPAALAARQNHLARVGALRRGSVVRVLTFVIRSNIIVVELEVLQTECSLIGNLKPYEPIRKSGGFTTGSTGHALRPDYEPCFGGLHIQQSCMASATEKSANGLSYHGHRGASNPAGGTPSSLALPAEPANWKTVVQINAENLRYSYRPEFITVKATISSVNSDQFCYSACPLMVNGKRCNKETGRIHGALTWDRKRYGHRFECSEHGHSVCIQIQDHTGTAFVIAHEAAAKEIFGFTAKDLYYKKYEEQDYAGLDGIIRGVLGKQYVFQLQVIVKPSSGGWLVGCMVLKAEEVNPSAESHRLVGAIDMVLPEGVGSRTEFGNSIMPTCYSRLSDPKGRPTVLSSNCSYAISAARATWLGSANRFGQQANGSAAKPAPSLSAVGVHGCGGDHGAQTCPSDTGGQRPPAPDGFVGRLYGAGGIKCRLNGRLPLSKVAREAPRKSSTQTSSNGAEESRGEH